MLITDVTERNRLDRQLREGAFRDPLTGGANRVCSPSGSPMR